VTEFIVWAVAQDGNAAPTSRTAARGLAPRCERELRLMNGDIYPPVG
jgi:hypothetical protein